MRMLESSPSLEDSILLAVRAHEGQKDKAGQPYILHPLRMMVRLHGEAERIAAVLHDVVEDTSYTLDDLRGLGYSGDVLHALDCLTRREAETYDDFLCRVIGNPIALRVKVADLEDNMDERRLADITERDCERLGRYRKAWAKLTGLV